MSSSTLGRTLQYASLARQAFKLRRADEQQVQENARRHLVERMGKLRGLPQKLGQMLSFTRGDEPAADEYAALQESAEPLPLDAVRPVMEQSWGAPVDTLFAEFESHAHAASLGQVHRARLRDGRHVAVKVQYPGIREAINTDLKLLGWLSIPVGNLRRGFDLSGYRCAITEDLDRELDYSQEAATQIEFARVAQSDAFVCVPDVISELSGERVLVTCWHDGEHFSNVESTWSEPQRRALANRFLRFFLESLFLRGVVHADLHPGNLRFRRDGTGGVQLVLYDFGSVYRSDATHRAALARLIRATARRDESPWPLFLELGFDAELLEPLAHKLPALCQVLFEPFVVERPYDLAGWQLGRRVSDILGDDRWNFRTAGPPSMVFLLRAFHGLIYYLEKLRTPIFWNRPMASILDSIGDDLDRLALPDCDQPGRGFDCLARHLKIRVTENGRTKVELTFAASAIDELANLIDEDLSARIARRGFNLDRIVADARRRGYAPGPVFRLEESSKQIDIRLE